MNLIKALMPILVLVTFAGVCPYMLIVGKNNKKIKRYGKLLNILTKLPVVVLIIVSTIWGISACQNRKLTISSAIKNLQNYLYPAASINNLIFTFVNRRKMIQTLTRFVAVDSQLRSVSTQINYESSRRRISISLVMCAIAWSLKYFLNILSAAFGFKTTFCVVIYIPSYTSMVVLVCYLVILLNELKARFKALNFHISEILEVVCSRMLPEHKCHLIITNHTTEAILNCSNIHGELCDIGRLINKSFEAQILLKIFVCFVTTVSTSFSLVTESNFTKNNSFILYDTITNVTGFLLIFYAFTTAAMEAKKTINIIHNYQHRLNFNEVIVFSHQLYFKTTNFNIYGLFPLDWSALYFLITTLFTYVLLLIQFKN